jgi:hypothetical protein
MNSNVPSTNNEWIKEGCWAIHKASGLLFKIVIVAKDTHTGQLKVGFKHGKRSYIMDASLFSECYRAYESA